jgi:hypothetical protein
VTTKRGKLVAIILLAIIAGALALIRWRNRGGQRATLAVSFIGYTNLAMTTATLPAGFMSTSTNPIKVPAALIRATNTGTVSLRVWTINLLVMPTNQPLRSDYMSYNATPQLVKPGESVGIHAYLFAKMPAWHGFVAYSRWEFPERTRNWASTNGNAAIWKFVDWSLPKPRDSTAEFGPITNEMPDIEALNR